MSNKTMKHARYWTIGMSIMLLSSMLFASLSMESSEEEIVDSNTTNDDVNVQSPDPGHFRFSHINWRTTGTPNQVEFNVLSAFTRSEYPTCIDTGTLGSIPCTGPGGLPGVGNVIRETVANGHLISGTGVAGTELFFGDGTNSGALLYRVDAINLSENSFLAHAIDPSQPSEKIRHSYPSAGIFTAEINDFSRNAVEENNFVQGYRVSTIVDLSISNRSPVSTIAPVIVCPADLCTFPIPATDPDGDTLNFRLSTSSEASNPLFGTFTQPGEGTPQPLTISSAGIVTWNAAGFEDPPFCAVAFDPLCLYSTSITIEEKRGGNVIGKVMVDFLINIAAPSFDVPPTPANGFTFNIIVGVILPFAVQCSDPNAGDTVTIGTLGLPIDASLSPSIPGNPATRIFTFAPTAVQTVSVTFTCTDTQGNSAIPHTINIVVSPAPPRIVKTVHAEKESFTVVQDGIPLIADVTIIAEIFEDLNTQLVMKQQAEVVTCLRFEDNARLIDCNVTIPPANFVPVENCTELPVNSVQAMNTVVKGGSSSNSEGMNTVNRGALVKTIQAQKQIFECDFNTPGPEDDLLVHLVTFTEIFENLNRLNLDPPQDPTISRIFISFRCVISEQTGVVQACEFEQLFS
ncbi:MAG: hypothetical protein ACRD38_01120 [Nitrososphaerales archaeon]